MEWSRIKTIILIILAVTNIGLLVFLAQRELLDQGAQQEARQNAILFLQNNGISVADEEIPLEMNLLPQIVEWDREQERQAASVLLGGTVQEQAWSDEIYRYYNESGTIQFHRDGTFQGEFVQDAFPAEDGSLSACGLEVLNPLNFFGEEISVQEEASAGETVITYRQLWNNFPIFNHQAVLTFRDGCLVSFSGRRLTGSPQPNSTQTPISIPTALFQFYHGMVTLGDVCSRIDQIIPGYITSAGTGPSALTPVWYIVTDTRSYRLDTLTGALSRAEESGGGESQEKS